jgi:hypothetical protein
MDMRGPMTYKSACRHRISAATGRAGKGSESMKNNDAATPRRE